MKISIIIPVYNEEKLISKCIEALLNQDYPKKDYEIIVVNDGSVDNTLNEIKKYPARVVNLKENKGRSIARESGAKAAKYNNLLFIDSRCIAYRDILKNIKKINYQPIVGNSIMDINRNIFDCFFWLIRMKIYQPYFGEKFNPVFITKKNFDDIGKGTTIFFCDKKLFLSSQIENKESKDSSDDTKLLWNIVNKKKILRHSKIKVIYQSRTQIKKQIIHLFKRGLKFVDYYFKPGKNYFWGIIIFLIIICITILLISFKPIYLIYELLLIFVIMCAISIWLSRSIKDFFKLLFLFPIVAVSFGFGILNGILYKILKKY